MSEVRRADVRRGVSGVAVKEPRFGVKARRTDVVGYADLGPQALQQVERSGLSRTSVRGCENAYRSAGLSVSSYCIAQWSDPTTTNECHHHIDPVRRCNLGQDLMPDTRFTRCVGQQRGVE